MKFLIISHVLHKKYHDLYFGYAPYVKEMNLWIKEMEEVSVVAPCIGVKPDTIDIHYNGKIKFVSVPAFSLISFSEILKSIVVFPFIFFKVVNAMRHTDHIHLRLPGNMGLIGVIAQIFFPSKPKSVKYAGNWDPNSNQPWSYRLQKRIVRNTFLSRNIKVLVYGAWENQSKNIVPFFTASYIENEIFEVEKKTLDGKINLIFVGTLTANKRPMLAVKTLKSLIDSGIDTKLELYGEGSERVHIEKYVREHHIENHVHLMGNQDAEVLKKAYQKAHFLIFASQSEGWPKVVAEAMIWKCLPITTRVSCVPYMLDYGNRGSLVNPNIEEINQAILFYQNNISEYQDKCQNAYLWSKEFTLEKFEKEIYKIIYAKSKA